MSSPLWPLGTGVGQGKPPRVLFSAANFIQTWFHANQPLFSGKTQEFRWSANQARQVSTIIDAIQSKRRSSTCEIAEYKRVGHKAWSTRFYSKRGRIFIMSCHRLRKQREQTSKEVRLPHDKCDHSKIIQPVKRDRLIESPLILGLNRIAVYIPYIATPSLTVRPRQKLGTFSRAEINIHLKM